MAALSFGLTRFHELTYSGKKPSPWLYLGAGMVAVCKDLLDLVGIGSFPGIGTAVTICANILIFFILLLDRSGGGSQHNRTIIRGLIQTAITIVEGFGFGLNFFPIQTAMVIGLYILAKRAWKKEEKAFEAAEQVRQNQLRVAEQAARWAEYRAAQEEAESPVDEPPMEEPRRLDDVVANDPRYAAIASLHPRITHTASGAQRVSQGGSNVVSLDQARQSRMA